MDQHLAKLISGLRRRAGGKARVRRDDLWEAYYQVFPADVGSVRARSNLAGMLRELESCGLLVLPKTETGWDTNAEPRLPQWIGLGSSPAAPPKPDFRTFPWRPELRFVADLDREPCLEELMRINEFFKSGGAQRPLVPVRERSVLLFGDEKRLDELAETTLFREDRLSFDLLRCFPVSPPLVWEAEHSTAGAPRPILIIENHHTYHSFCRWNRGEGDYAAVVYGAGEVIARNVEFLRDILAASPLASGFEYFGDLDPEGVRIPIKASAKALRLGLAPIAPAVRWYQLLLEIGKDALITTRSKGKPLSEAELGWFPEALRPALRHALAAQRRLPQELLGWECLSRVMSASR